MSSALGLMLGFFSALLVVSLIQGLTLRELIKDNKSPSPSGGGGGAGKKSQKQSGSKSGQPQGGDAGKGGQQPQDGQNEPIAGIKVVDPGYPCRRRGTPRLTVACVARHLVEPGDIVKKGDPIAELRDIWGRPAGEKILRSEYDGWIMGRTHGIVHYPGIDLCGMGVRDELPTVLPYPKSYFKP